LFLRQIIKTVAALSDFNAKIHQNPISARDLPQMPLWELTALLRPPSWILAGLLITRWEGWMAWEGRKGWKGKGGEERGVL